MSGAEASRVIVVRHGETAWNREGRMQGHRDSPLTALGRSQAETLAERISAIGPIRAIFSSDLGRARETAAPIARRSGLPVAEDPRLRERCLGIFEGRTGEEASEAYPAEWRRFQSRDPDFVIPGGESASGTAERVREFLTEAAESHPGATIVAVTHGGALDGIFRFVVGLPLGAPRRFRIPNAALNVVALAEGLWRLETWGIVDGEPELLDDA